MSNLAVLPARCEFLTEMTAHMRKNHTRYFVCYRTDPYTEWVSSTIGSGPPSNHLQDVSVHVREVSETESDRILDSDEPSKVVAELFNLPYAKVIPEIDRPLNIVELLEGFTFNQACRFGALVEGHSVYCHNPWWIDAPSKCRRTWYTGGEVQDEDCPGFEPNSGAK